MNGSKQQERIDPDCRTCIYAETCGQAQAGRFCGQWQSRVPERWLPDPNEQWERGEPAEF